jgi:hypothetical protein
MSLATEYLIIPHVIETLFVLRGGSRLFLMSSSSCFRYSYIYILVSSLNFLLFFKPPKIQIYKFFLLISHFTYFFTILFHCLKEKRARINIYPSLKRDLNTVIKAENICYAELIRETHEITIHELLDVWREIKKTPLESVDIKTDIVPKDRLQLQKSHRSSERKASDLKNIP